jgi:hypothetical protein
MVEIEKEIQLLVILVILMIVVVKFWKHNYYLTGILLLGTIWWGVVSLILLVDQYPIILILMVFNVALGIFAIQNALYDR